MKLTEVSEVRGLMQYKVQVSLVVGTDPPPPVYLFGLPAIIPATACSWPTVTMPLHWSQKIFGAWK
jgi:hypothetical protein